MKLFSIAVLALALNSVSVFAATKTYQVTGPVLEVSDQMIVVQKGKERWELARTPETKIDGELKVGAKVTIQYSMTAQKVEAKGGAAAAEPAKTKKKK
jgi:hypothetical protein